MRRNKIFPLTGGKVSPKVINIISISISKTTTTMCGIAGIFNIKSQTPELRSKALKMAQKIRHRGPDWSGIYVGGSAILAHERLSIVDPQSGGQPLYSPDRKQILAVNGEIYNHRDIRRSEERRVGKECG